VGCNGGSDVLEQGCDVCVGGARNEALQGHRVVVPQLPRHRLSAENMLAAHTMTHSIEMIDAYTHTQARTYTHTHTC
jgi:hypothetical protein